MKYTIFLCLFAISFLVGCNSDQPTKTSIQRLEDSLKINRDNTEFTQNLLKQYETYAEKGASADEKPTYYIKAADLAKAIENYPKAIQLYEKVYTEFKDHEKAGQALFMEAFTYDNSLKNIAKAKELYEKFIKEYPKHEFVDDAQASLKVLGLSDEEALKKILEGQKGED